MRLGLALDLVGQGTALFESTASLALSFTTGQYRVGTGGSSSPDFASLPGLTVTRASVGYAETSAGALVLFGTGVARITDKGLLIEEARTNLFLNSFAPATQNVTITAVSHTITVWGTGSVTVAAGTATISNGGAVTAGSPRTIGCTVGGTISVTVTGSPTAVQVEAGAFGTSPIPTSGASATRAADSVSIGSLSTPAPYTILAVLGTQPVTQNSDIILNNTANDGTLLYETGGSGRAVVNEAGIATANVSGGSAASQSVPFKIAGRFQLNNVNASVNGSIGTADTSSAPQTLTNLGIGRALYGFGSAANFYLSRVVIYPRALSDAELQAATT